MGKGSGVGSGGCGGGWAKGSDSATTHNCTTTSDRGQTELPSSGSCLSSLQALAGNLACGEKGEKVLSGTNILMGKMLKAEEVFFVTSSGAEFCIL